MRGLAASARATHDALRGPRPFIGQAIAMLRDRPHQSEQPHPPARRSRAGARRGFGVMPILSATIICGTARRSGTHNHAAATMKGIDRAHVSPSIVMLRCRHHQAVGQRSSVVLPGSREPPTWRGTPPSAKSSETSSRAARVRRRGTQSKLLPAGGKCDQWRGGWS